ncbi:MAG: RAD55 family ATPase, partial [Thermoplasmatota archaeon]
MPLISTAIKGLDEEIGGGIPPGSIVLLSGTPGTFKSSMAFGILHEAARTRGAVGLYLLLEQSMGSLLSQQEKMGRPLDEKVQSRIIVSDVGRIRAAMDKFSKEDDWMGALRSYVEYLVEQRSAELLVIDSLPVLEILSRETNRREFLFNLFEWIRGLGTTTFLINEKPSLEVEYGEEEFLSDGVFKLT